MQNHAPKMKLHVVCWHVALFCLLNTWSEASRISLGLLCCKSLITSVSINIRPSIVAEVDVWCLLSYIAYSRNRGRGNEVWGLKELFDLISLRSAHSQDKKKKKLWCTLAKLSIHFHWEHAYYSNPVRHSDGRIHGPTDRRTDLGTDGRADRLVDRDRKETWLFFTCKAWRS